MDSIAARVHPLLSGCVPGEKPVSIGDIRKARGINVKIGGRVRYTGGKSPRLGTVVGTHCGQLRIKLDGDKRPGTYHPTWELEFLPDAVPCAESVDCDCERCDERNGVQQFVSAG